MAEQESKAETKEATTTNRTKHEYDLINAEQTTYTWEKEKTAHRRIM